MTGHVFHRALNTKYPVAAHGDGVYLVDREGKRYLDASGGAAVSCLGHSDPDVIAAIKAQLDTLPFAHTAFFTNEAMEDLAQHLVQAARAKAAARTEDALEKVLFVSGGSEAIEAALKLARQYFVEIGEPSRSRFIARRQSYHGSTLAALSVGGNRWRQQQYAPLLLDASHIAPCYAYRDCRAEEDLTAYGERVAAELEAEIERQGPQRVIAFIAEPVVGATLGAVPPVPGYFKRIRDICTRHGVLLILDEVMCGMGRTGTLFAYEQEGIVPDIVCIAKGLGGGYQPIGAVLASGRIHRAIADGSGFFQHGHTYMGHPAACAAALAVQRAIGERNLLSRVAKLGAGLRERLKARFGNHPNVGDIRGRGLFWGLELMADRLSKEPFPPERRLHARLKSAAMDRGLICYPMGGTLDGRRGDHVLLAPPFIVEEAHLDELCDKLAGALDAALAA